MIAGLLSLPASVKKTPLTSALQKPESVDQGGHAMQSIPGKDLENIHTNVLRVLREVGLKVENAKLLDVLAAIGAEIDGQVARFPSGMVEELLAAAREETSCEPPRLTVRASVFAGRYLDPATRELTPMDTDRTEAYWGLARALPNVNAMLITGWPWSPQPELEPLLERFYCWKLGAGPSGILYPAESAEHLLDLYQAYAELKDTTVEDAFVGGVFMQSPLRFSREEADQFEWWWSRGYRVGIAHMTTAGLTGPVTPAGLVTVHLAEAIAIGLIRKACYGEDEVSAHAMLAPMDVRSLGRPYGRPEMTAANLLFAAMARRYGLRCFLHSGLTDAPRPSCEAGYQKAMSSIAALMAGADGMLEAGLLAGDTVFSPIQMILDNEFAGAMERMLSASDCSDDAIGFEAIVEAGHGGLYTGLEHTVERFRDELWEPSVWTREPAGEGTPALDVDRARERYEELRADLEPPALLSPEEEGALLKVIQGRGA